MENKDQFFGEPCHDILVANAKQSMTYDPSLDFEEWNFSIRHKLFELTGIYDIEKNEAPELDLQIEYEEQKEGYTKIRFTFASEIGTRVPCYLLIPNTGKEKYPVAITLQGHSTGFHNSVGEIQYEKDLTYQPRGQFGLQAVKNGYISLCIEQRGMGERRPTCDSRKGAQMCGYTALTAFMMGRTILGERMFDVHKAIDALAHFPKCDTDKILITGNHDGPWAKKAANQGYFESVLPYLETHLNGYAVTMCHYPMLEWKGSREDPPHRIGYHIHGHIHNRVADEYIPLYRQFNALNAGMDVNGFVPVTFEELLENNAAFKLACLARDEDRAYLLAGLERHPFRCVGSDSV